MAATRGGDGAVIPRADAPAADDISVAPRGDPPPADEDLPISDLHLPDQIEKTLEGGGLRSMNEVISGEAILPKAQLLLGQDDLERLSEVARDLADQANSEGSIDWEAFWAGRGVLSFPDDDREVPARECLARLPDLLSFVLLAEEGDEERGRRAWEIVRHRSGLDGHSYTLAEIGSGFGLTRARIQQIEKEATAILERSVRDGFNGRRHRVRPRFLASLAAMRACAPTAAEPLVREDVLLARLGLLTEMDVPTRNRLEYLLDLYGLVRTEPDRITGPIWRLPTEDAARRAAAIAGIREVLADEFLDGATELEIAIAVNRRAPRRRIDAQVVPALLPLMVDLELLSDGRVRAPIAALATTEHMAYRLLRDAGDVLPLVDMLRTINAVRPARRQLYRGTFSNMLSGDPRFVPLGKTGQWGLAGRDDRVAIPMKKRISEALRRLAGPSTAKVIAVAMDPPEPDHNLVTSYLHQMRPRTVVQLKTGAWVLSEWPEASKPNQIKVHAKRGSWPTAAQVAADEALEQMLTAVDDHSLPIDEVVAGLMRDVKIKRPAAYYRIERSARVMKEGKGRDCVVRLRDRAAAGDS